MGINFNTGDYKKSYATSTSIVKDWIGSLDTSNVTEDDYKTALQSIIMPYMDEFDRKSLKGLKLRNGIERLGDISESAHDYWGDWNVWAIYALLICLKNNYDQEEEGDVSDDEVIDDFLTLFKYATEHQVCITWNY